MKYSIKSVWMLIILCIVLIPSFIVIPLIAYQSYQHDISLELAKESLINLELEKEIEFKVKSLIDTLKNKSDSIDYTWSKKQDEQLIKSLLEKMLERDPSIHGLMIFSAKGHGLIGLDRNLEGNYYSPEQFHLDKKTFMKRHWGLNWDEEIRSPEFVVPVLGRHYVGPVRSIDNRYLFNISVPLSFNGETVAFFLAEIDIGRFWQAHLAKVESKGIISYLVDQRGVLLTTIPGSRYQAGELVTHLGIVRSALTRAKWDNELVYKGIIDKPAYGVVRHIDILNWSIISELEESFIVKTLDGIVLQTVLIALVVLILSVLAGYYIVRIILIPIKTVTDGMQMYANNEAGLKQIPETNIIEVNDIVNGFNRMVIERSQMDDILQRSQQRLVLHREQAPLGVIEWNTKFEFLDWNPAAEKIFGFTKQEVLGKHITQTILPESARPAVDQVWQELLNRTGGRHSINENMCSDGRIITCEWHNTPLVNEEGVVVGVASFVEDITEKVSQEEHIRRSQKMDALGKLTGGISHDFNNLLNAIMGYADLISERTENDKIKRYADIIFQASTRGTKLTKKLLNFSSSQANEATEVNINSLIEDERSILEKSLTARIKLQLTLDPDLWPAFLDNADLQDAILNISINSMHAIEGNGELSITTSNEYISGKFAKSIDLISGDYTCIKITDNGCGMDAKTLSQIFDPFYTTKGDRGTGLGMSQVYGFIKRTNGGIDIESKEGVGTTISLYFPRYIPLVSDSDEEIPKLSVEEDLLLKGSETILLVDDEESLRVLGQEILEDYGYHVITAENYETALSVLNVQQVDLVFSDVIMPEKDGYQLAKVIQEQWPKIKIQMVSGFSDDKDKVMDNDELHRNLLYKPYKAKDLLQKIRLLLNAS